MLYADKAALTNRARLRMLQIRERELDLYTQNSRVIATKSALLCGIGFQGLIYARKGFAFDTNHLFYKHAYPLALVVLIGFSLLALLNFSMIAMLAPGLALRGPDGSVAISIEAVTIEYRTASFFFGLAVLALHAVLVAYAWGADHSLPTQLLLTTLSAYSLHLTVHQSLTVGRQFRVEEYTSGAFTPAPMGPAHANSGGGQPHADDPTAGGAQSASLLPREAERSDLAAAADVAAGTLPACGINARAEGSAAGGGAFGPLLRAAGPLCAVSAALSRGVELGIGSVGRGVETLGRGVHGLHRGLAQPAGNRRAGREARGPAAAPSADVAAAPPARAPSGSEPGERAMY